MSNFLHRLRQASRQRDSEIEGSSNMGLSFHSNELGGEVGELQNKIKKLDRYLLGHGKLNNERYPVEVIEGLRDEVADVIICVDKLCVKIEQEFGETINIEPEVKRKFNKFSHENDLDTRL